MWVSLQGIFVIHDTLLSVVDGTIVARLSKEASFMGRKFKLEKLSELNEGEGERMVLAIMMMSLLERRRG